MNDSNYPFKGFTGFIYVRCPVCGEERGFCTKAPTSQAHCRSCGNSIDLSAGLRSVHFRCECGMDLKYRTNITDPIFDLPCIECGSPNTVEYIRKQGRYKGVSFSGRRKRKKICV